MTTIDEALRALQQIEAYVSEGTLPSPFLLDRIGTELDDRYIIGFAEGVQVGRRQRQGFDGWLPTAHNINALPDPIRKYIHDLEARCDPAGEVAGITLLRDQVDSLCKIITLHNMLAAAPDPTTMDKGGDDGR